VDVISHQRTEERRHAVEGVVHWSVDVADKVAGIDRINASAALSTHSRSARYGLAQRLPFIRLQNH
jgi:hypothetical protein